MPYERKDNTFSLFKDEGKTKDGDRDYKGEAKINGVEYWLSGYVNETKDGKKFLGGTIKPKDEKPQKSTKSIRDDLEDEVPF